MTEKESNTMFTFLRDGVPEQVKPELWRWEAHYLDGSVLKQFDDNMMFHQFSEIDQSKLHSFKMVSDLFDQVYVVPFDFKRMKLIHFYKNYGLKVGTPDFTKIRLYCFGYEDRDSKPNRKHLLVILPNGETILCEDPSIISFE